MSPENDLQNQIELLVDGELDPAERASLLRHLDSEPRAWRQCALTFMEDQFLKEELTPHRTTSAPPLFRTVAIAAAILCAFTLGALWTGTANPENELAGAPATPPPAHGFDHYPATDRVVFEERQFGGRRLYSTREDLPPIILEAVVRAGHSVQQVERTIKLPSGDGDPIELPVRETIILDTGPTAL